MNRNDPSASRGAFAVEGGDLRSELLGDLAADLRRGRQLAAGLGEVLLEDREIPDRFRA